MQVCGDASHRKVVECRGGGVDEVSIVGSDGYVGIKRYKMMMKVVGDCCCILPAAVHSHTQTQV